MRRVLGSRAALFGAERAISAGGGLAFTALLVRGASVEAAAGFLAAWAVAALFQPIFANALSPLAVRLWRQEGEAAFLGFWVVLQGAALLIAGIASVISASWLGAMMFLQVAAAPMALLSAPYLARDAFRPLLSILIPSALLGAALRISVLAAGGDLVWAAACFAVEPLVGGICLARGAGLQIGRARIGGAAFSALRARAPALIFAMAATTLFWRSPVLLADLHLEAAGIVAIAIAMQIANGLCLPANALAQSLFGPLAADRIGAKNAVWVVAALSGVSAIAALALFGEAFMALLYGEAARGAAQLALLLAPLAALAPLWRIDAFTAGLYAEHERLIRTRLIALAGQAALAIGLFFTSSAVLIAVVTPVSMFVSVFAGAVMAGKRPDFAAVFSPPALRRSLKLLFQG